MPREGTRGAYQVVCRTEDGREECLEADVVLVCNGWQANQILGCAFHGM